jgi:hypothetical protein
VVKANCWSTHTIRIANEARFGSVILMKQTFSKTLPSLNHQLKVNYLSIFARSESKNEFKTDFSSEVLTF